MRFNEIIEKILSYPNGSITTKENTYYGDIHRTVRRFQKKVNGIDKPAENIISIMIKEQMIELLSALENKKIRLKAVNTKK